MKPGKEKIVYRGIGNEFRELSQAKLLCRLHELYHFKTVLQAPFDHATDPEVDNRMFPSYVADTSLEEYQENSFDLVWNFGFLQRHPSTIHDMARVSRRYVLAFVPNGLNPGVIFHRIYHATHSAPCDHPEGGEPAFMNLKGLQAIFQEGKIKVLEAGYIDAPIWFDTVVTLVELAGSSSRRPLRIPFTHHLLAIEKITMQFSRVMAHHAYSFGSIQ